MNARQVLRAKLLKIPGSVVRGAAERVYLPLKAAVAQKDALVEAISEFARSLGAR